MNLSGKRVAVYGLGVTGLAVLEALQSIDLKELVIVDGAVPNKSDLELLTFRVKPTLKGESEAQSLLAQMDIILLSPGIPRSKESLTQAHEVGVKVWNEIEWCAQGYEGKILAITGTNGKTTTVTLLDHAFKEAGVRVFTGGNIGVPFSSIYHQRELFDLVLLEMSSFQCESLESFRPHIAGYLNLFANHGERYESVEAYRLAKWDLVKNQTSADMVFCGPGAGEPAFDMKSSPIKMPSSWKPELDGLVDWAQVKLVGEHNRQNIWFAWKIFSSYFSFLGEEVPVDTFLKTLYSFSGVEHRVEVCSPFNNHLVFNDAKSTNWQATKSALKAVLERNLPIVLIVGGQLRGLNDGPDQELLKFLVEKASHILAMGEAAPFLVKEIEGVVDVKSLEGARVWIEENCKQKHALLFSPAFPSFDQFKNYAERGAFFKKEFSN